MFHSLGCPILFGASRKRMIGALDNEAPADQRLGRTVALHYQAATQGAQLLRVNDIAENRQALGVWRGLKDAAVKGQVLALRSEGGRVGEECRGRCKGGGGMCLQKNKTKERVT